jgi:hypothetical protein
VRGSSLIQQFAVRGASFDSSTEKMNPSAASNSDAVAKYQKGEFKRRIAMSSIRRELQGSMLEKHENLWWCKDEALSLIRDQMVESTNHCVIAGFLGEGACAAVRKEVIAAYNSNLLSTEVWRCTTFIFHLSTEQRITS